jgi:hypothetical protein
MTDCIIDTSRVAVAAAAAKKADRPALPPRRGSSDSGSPAPAPLLMESQWLSKLEARMGQVQQQVRQLKDWKGAQQSPPSVPSVCSEGSLYDGYAFGQQRQMQRQPPKPAAAAAAIGAQQQKQQQQQKHIPKIPKASKQAKSRGSDGGVKVKAKPKAKASKESPALLLGECRRCSSDEVK